MQIEQGTDGLVNEKQLPANMFIGGADTVSSFAVL
jgi:hypothetical protein